MVVASAGPSPCSNYFWMPLASSQKSRLKAGKLSRSSGKTFEENFCPSFIFITDIITFRERREQEQRERDRLDKERAERERREKERELKDRELREREKMQRAKDERERQAVEADVNRHFELSIELARKVSFGSGPRRLCLY